jgi:integrase
MTKNDDKRSIPLNRIVWDIVKEKSRARYLASDYVFINDAGTKMDGGNFRTDYMKVLKKAKIEAFTFHDLRHAFATKVSQN